MDPKTDKVAGLLEKMKLTDSEKRSIKIGGTSGGSISRNYPQVVGKVLADKPVRVEALVAVLGKI